MKRKVRFLGGILAAIMFVTACQKTQVVDESVSGLKEDEVALVKCDEGNPMAGKSDTGDYIYGGDPSVLVDGDTVYVYTGHDISKDDQVERKVYNIPEYLCYSSKDLKTWKAEGSVTLAQDADASEQTAQNQTFRTVKGLKTSRGTSFESVAYPGKYLVLKDGMLKLGTKEDKEEATFYIDKK